VDDDGDEPEVLKNDELFRLNIIRLVPLASLPTLRPEKLKLGDPRG
jgi:hypothetical protein